MNTQIIMNGAREIIVNNLYKRCAERMNINLMAFTKLFCVLIRN